MTKSNEASSSELNQNNESQSNSLESASGFSFLFLGSLFSTTGDRLYQIALISIVMTIYGDKGAEDGLSWIHLAGILPQFLLYPFVGPFVDKRDRRRLLWGIPALKIILVLLFAPLLWKCLEPGINRETFDQNFFPWQLALVFLLSLLTLPFSPARSAAIPDTSTENTQSRSAGLIAVSGLLSILGGTFLGMYISHASVLGPGLTIYISSGLFVLGALLLCKLPQAVAVPGAVRFEFGSKQNGEEKTRKGYLKDLLDGWKYCRSTRGVFSLIWLESIFWILAALIYLLFVWHQKASLGFQDPDFISAFGDHFGHFHFAFGLGFAGIGLLLGALWASKMCKNSTPILTFPLGLFIIGLGSWFIFTSEAGASPEETKTTAYILHFWMFTVGFGGGMFLGRIEADILVLTDPKMRGRVFAVKGFIFTAALIAAFGIMGWIGTTPQENDWKSFIALSIPIAAWILIFPVFFASWNLDIALWLKQRDVSLKMGLLHFILWKASQLICRLLAFLYFGTRFYNSDKVPKNGPVILAANHGCFIDPFLLGGFQRRVVVYIMAMQYYVSWAHPLFKFFRTVPVEASGEGGNVKALRVGVRVLEENGVLGIFPEGHVTEDGNLQKPQTGAMFLAKQSGAIVVPVAIKGNHIAFPRQAKFPKPKPITLIAGEPFTVEKKTKKKELAARSDDLMAELAKLLDVNPPPKCEK